MNEQELLRQQMDASFNEALDKFRQLTEITKEIPEDVLAAFRYFWNGGVRFAHTFHTTLLIELFEELP
jgi:hypothetical protein